MKEISEKYGFDIDPDKKVYDMSVSEKQTVEIIKVLFRGADILILDEPTAVLTPQETEKLFAVLRNMRADGKAIVIITHKLHEVMALSDQVAVLRKGRYIGTVNTAETNPQALTEMMVGRAVSLNIDRPEAKYRDLRLEVKDLTVLTADGIKSPGGKDKWNAGAVRSILTNEKYKGDALLQKSYTVDFLTKKKKVNEGEIPQYYVEGNHEAIIQPEVFELVQQELKRRKQGRGPHSGVHLFSGKIRCGQCGEWYGSKVWHSNSKYRRVIWQCNHKYDGEEKCSTPHLTEDEIKAMFISAANKLIGKKTAIISPLRASLDIAFDTSALEAETEKLQEELMVASDLIQKCIYENAHVALNQREYQKRYDSLTARFDIAKARLEEIETAIADKKSRRAAIESFLDTLAQADLMGKFDPVLWCGLVDHVTVYARDDVLFTFKNGQEIRA